MEDVKIFKYLKEKGIPISKFAKMIGYQRVNLSLVMKRQKSGSRRMIRAIIDATGGEVDESDFIISTYER